MSRAPHRNSRSWLALGLGALSLGTGLAWMLASEWGVAPLDAFIAGSAELTGLTVGMLIVLLSVLFVAAAWMLGSRPAIGTPIVFVEVGLVVDLWTIVIFDALGLAPDDWSVATRVAVWVSGFLLFSAGVAATLASNLGASPYDQFVRVVHEKFGISMAISRLVFDGVVLVIALVIGGAWGVGTVAILILMPLALRWAIPVLHPWIHDEFTQEEDEITLGGASNR